MTTRDELIEILIKADRECRHLEQEQPYPCEGCEYRTLDRSIRGCIFDRYADAIIESGLLNDDKVYKYVNGNYCEKCGHFLSFRGYDYCPTCGCKLKDTKYEKGS